MPISDLFIAKRSSNDQWLQWQLFDAYKLNYGYNIVVSSNGFITTKNDSLEVIDANFSSTRRQNLNGVNVTCGLMVNDITWLSFGFFYILLINFVLKIAYPEKFTYVDDLANNHVDVFTKASINLGNNLRENLNIRFRI